jgi:hypothetical protein
MEDHGRIIHPEVLRGLEVNPIVGYGLPEKV